MTSNPSDKQAPSAIDTGQAPPASGGNGAVVGDAVPPTTDPSQATASTPDGQGDSLVVAPPESPERQADRSVVSSGEAIDTPSIVADLDPSSVSLDGYRGQDQPAGSSIEATPATTALRAEVLASEPSQDSNQLAQQPPAVPPEVPPTSDSVTPSPDEEEEEEGMTMLEHLEELRIRIVIACVALAVGLAVSAIPVPGYTSLTWNVIAVVNAPAGGSLQAIKPGEIFITYFKVAMVVGAALAMPVLIFQMMAFVMPALHPHEKKYLYMAMPGVTISFIVGILFGYLLLLPFAVNFLLNFGVAESGVDVKWTFGEYISTVTTLLFWMGLAFETPLIMFFLTKLRVISVERLQGFRKYALIGAFVIGAMITPTPDPLNQTIVSLPLYLLFELGILFAKLA